MASLIDVTKPGSGNAYTLDVRNNFLAAASEITALQDALQGGNITGPLTVNGAVTAHGLAISSQASPDTMNANVGLMDDLSVAGGGFGYLNAYPDDGGSTTKWRYLTSGFCARYGLDNTGLFTINVVQAGTADDEIAVDAPPPQLTMDTSGNLNLAGTLQVLNLIAQALPSAAPVESGSFWVDTADGNTVKYVP